MTTIPSSGLVHALEVDLAMIRIDSQKYMDIKQEVDLVGLVRKDV